jgi:hypothetical protein
VKQEKAAQQQEEDSLDGDSAVLSGTKQSNGHADDMAGPPAKKARRDTADGPGTDASMSEGDDAAEEQNEPEESGDEIEEEEEEATQEELAEDPLEAAEERGEESGDESD